MAGVVLLSSEQMRAAEEAAVKAGVSSAALMEKAGAAVAQVAMKAWTKRATVVVCGPGNNGGDGFVAARIMAAAGWPVTVLLLCERDALKGDAKLMADLFEGDFQPFSREALGNAGLIIDALFGTGLSRNLEGDAAEAVSAINEHPAQVLAVDLPSGVDANTGRLWGVAVDSARTVTFFAKKPGHVLFPGRALCGAIDVADIGIDPSVLNGGEA